MSVEIILIHQIVGSGMSIYTRPRERMKYVLNYWKEITLGSKQTKIHKVDHYTLGSKQTKIHKVDYYTLGSKQTKIHKEDYYTLGSKDTKIHKVNCLL